MTALHLASCSSLYRIVHALISNKADLFLCNSDGKSPLIAVGNNLLMANILKKAMKAYFRDTFEDCAKRPREKHLTSNTLLKCLTEKFIVGSSKRKTRRHYLQT
jgi:ankyrin repeat protein